MGEKQEDLLCCKLKDLTVDETVSEEVLAEAIANNLSESNRDLINKVVQTIGVRQSLIVYNQTLQIEEAGGLKREDGTGRKAPGGVFFYVLYHNGDIFGDKLKKIFSDEAHKKEKLRRMQIKVERRKKTELLKARFLEEGLLTGTKPNHNIEED